MGLDSSQQLKRATFLERQYQVEHALQTDSWSLVLQESPQRGQETKNRATKLTW